jgi:hypothetical protein
MSNQFDNWGSGEALAASILAAAQAQAPHPNAVAPPASPDSSLIDQFEQRPEPSSPSFRKV